MSVFISAYYYIPKPTLPHMGLGRYLKFMPDTFKMISGSRLYFFYDESWVAEIVAKMCLENKIEFIGQYRNREELMARRYAEAIYSSYDNKIVYCFKDLGKKEKGVAHHKNLVADNPSETYIDNLSVWLSKINYVYSVLGAGHSEDTYCWVDAGIAKFKYLRKNWRFREQKYAGGKINHYGSRMHFRGERLPLNASFLAGTESAWQDLYSRFYSRLEEHSSDGYLHDEETILSMVYADVPGLFHKIGEPYSHHFGRQRYLLRRLLDR